MLYTIENTKNIENITILLDGVKQGYVFEADTRKGYIKQYKLPFKIHKDDTEYVTLYGRVEVLVPAPPVEEPIILYPYQQSILDAILNTPVTTNPCTGLNYIGMVSKFHTVGFNLPRRSGKSTIAKFLSKYKSLSFSGNRTPKIDMYRGTRKKYKYFIFDDVSYTSQEIYEFAAQMLILDLVEKDFKVVILETKCH